MLLPADNHSLEPHASFDGGELDCGNGLLLLIRKHLDALEPGQLLEIKSVEPSVDEDLPAWCRLTKNELVSWTKSGSQRSFLVSKGDRSEQAQAKAHIQSIPAPQKVEFAAVTGLAAAGVVRPLSVMGIGSWPRPNWMLRSMHEYLENKLTDSQFHETADNAVRLAVEQQLEAGVDVVTDGEQRRDNYASFVGKRLTNVQLIPLLDLLPLVDHPEEFEQQLRSLDIPADVVRHPAVFGKLARISPLAADECRFLRSITSKPIKVALPGPYLLTRTMFLDCFKERAYETRESLAEDIVRVLREEISDLLAAGAAIIQLDEPILTEVVFGKSQQQRTFMCGALGERGDAHEELGFALSLINRVTESFPVERLAMHVCRGNWSPDESVALAGGYEQLLPVLQNVQVGTLFLEFCTPRAGDISILARLPERMRIGLGVVNPKSATIESVDDICERVSLATQHVPLKRILLTPDCGFATFADNPVASAQTAVRKLANMALSAERLQRLPN